MTETISKLKDILGDEFLKEITIQEAGDTNDPVGVLTNAKDIHCECSTLILKPNHARLIVPSDSMLEMEKDLKFLQHSDKFFKNLTRGCYWLVDDMYKFEQMGYTKEINPENQQKSSQANQTQDSSTKQGGQQQSQASFQASGDERQPNTSVSNGLRYLACAECNLCPLGWFDPKTKESYLYVW